MATNKRVSKEVRVAGMKMGITGLALAVLFLFLIPMFYGIVTALKTDNQLSMIGAPWWPAAEGTYTYEEIKAGLVGAGFENIRLIQGKDHMMGLVEAYRPS